LVGWHAETYAGPPNNVAGRLAITADDVATATSEQSQDAARAVAIPSDYSRTHCLCASLATGTDLRALRAQVSSPDPELQIPRRNRCIIVGKF
jgi:hypothetical protein